MRRLRRASSRATRRPRARRPPTAPRSRRARRARSWPRPAASSTWGSRARARRSWWRWTRRSRRRAGPTPTSSTTSAARFSGTGTSRRARLRCPTAAPSRPASSACRWSRRQRALPSAAAAEGSAVALGSAFHRAAQFAAQTGRAPDAARIDALARAFGLADAQRARLAGACARWFASDTCAEALAWPLRRAEAPFFVRVGDAFMEGEIDLLCTEGPEAAGRALVVDYKTGGSDDEDAQAVRAKHELQAQCYAYALLEEGFDAVELRFARVEREEPDGRMQEARYTFAADQKDALRNRIESAR
ncbi:PD-(D/E)XK nuclease family protein [Arabiibacter massiliensis]|uniref:PD-(D/E)XK nuclease family protein n=1 Tax=Arabiibacter massiliensis TaxID=1870985 RepID=UPI001E442979|nr:PD-(D/E)XK nuclease family protein [Arabiibacter massiliensis]